MGEIPPVIPHPLPPAEYAMTFEELDTQLRGLLSALQRLVVDFPTEATPYWLEERSDWEERAVALAILLNYLHKELGLMEARLSPGQAQQAHVLISLCDSEVTATRRMGTRHSGR